MNGDKRLASPKKRKYLFEDVSFMQCHGGREKFLESEWGKSSEYHKSFVASDFADSSYRLTDNLNRTEQVFYEE